MRTATVSFPAVIKSGILLLFFKTNVRDPGQKAAANNVAFLGIWVTIFSKESIEGMCTINGLKNGRFFVEKMLFIAFSLNIFPAKPYTVSVGIATNSSSVNSCTAFCMFLDIMLIMNL